MANFVRISYLGIKAPVNKYGISGIELPNSSKIFEFHTLAAKRKKQKLIKGVIF